MSRRMWEGMAVAVLLAGMSGAALGAPDHGGFGRGEGSLQPQLGPRPFFLVADMDEGPLKGKLTSCAKGPFARSDFSIGHRGAALQFPEHTRESYQAAARMGAGIIECDVTFTRDKALVCRHSQCDLHTTTDILATPLAEKCSQNFAPAEYDPVTGELLQAAQANCCTSDITLAEFKTLQGKMDGANPGATTVEDYLAGTPNWRTELYSARGTLVTHAESITLIRSLGAKFTPELKAPSVLMPFDSDGDGIGDYGQQDYARQLIDEYRTAGVKASRVWPQSFSRDDVLYWIEHEPAFGQQAVLLDDADNTGELPDAAELAGYVAAGIHIVAPPLWALLALDEQGDMVPSRYALDARAVGLDIITWTLERSGPLATSGGWYYQTVGDAIDNDGDMFVALDVLARDVGVLGVFSDWPATVTYYANCMGLR